MFFECPWRERFTTTAYNVIYANLKDKNTFMRPFRLQEYFIFVTRVMIVE